MNAIETVQYVLADHFSKLTDRISNFTETGCSFEEWFNWECFHAFVASGLECRPKPSYSEFEGELKNKLADFAVTLKTGEKVVFEVKLVHDYTQNKWSSEIEKDNEKLKTIKNDVKAIQILVLTSEYEDLMKNEAWSKFLHGLSFWQMMTDVKINLPLTNGGQMLIYGGVVNQT